jgi:hypothetical protein
MVMARFLVMALVLRRMLTMISGPHERMPRLCKTLLKIETRNIVLTLRMKLMRCDGEPMCLGCVRQCC